MKPTSKREAAFRIIRIRHLLATAAEAAYELGLGLGIPNEAPECERLGIGIIRDVNAELENESLLNIVNHLDLSLHTHGLEAGAGIGRGIPMIKLLDAAYAKLLEDMTADERRDLPDYIPA